jgi:phosphosulfolactate phosphohydrolase-like enzyme
MTVLSVIPKYTLYPKYADFIIALLRGLKGDSKMEDTIISGQIIDTLYEMIIDNINDEICQKCPVVRSIRDLRDSIRSKNNQKVLSELGMSFPTVKCPCEKDRS